MRPITVSVAMITYNQAPYVTKAVESVVNQQRDFDLQVVIGDDASKDETPEILRELQKRHDCIELQLRTKNLGAHENFRRVFASLKGQYLAQLEGDDYWTDDRKLMKQLDFMEKHPECTVVGGYTRIEKEGFPPDQLPLDEHISFLKGDTATLEDFLHTHFLHTSSYFFRNVLNGELPPDYSSVLAGDRLLVLLHAQHGSIGFMREFFSVYRQTPSGILTGIDRVRASAHEVKFYEKVDRLLEPKYTPAVKRELTLKRLHHVGVLYDAGMLSEARQELARIWGGYKGNLKWRQFLALNLRVCFPKIYSGAKGAKKRLLGGSP